jgi:hypothetical protein
MATNMRLDPFVRETNGSRVIAGFLMGLLAAPAFWDAGLYGLLLKADAAEWF